MVEVEQVAARIQERRGDRLSYSQEDVVFCEREFSRAMSGWSMAMILGAALLIFAAGVVWSILEGRFPIVFIAGGFVVLVLCKGFFLINPEGAVTMVDMAIKMLAEHDVVHMDEKAKTVMVSNLMVVLCAEHSVQPVVHTGSGNSHAGET